ncbi:MAG: DNA adenine methylase [Clostridia bacterium]|nr:DNA adenine methylase [Clostridia bacterium]
MYNNTDSSAFLTEQIITYLGNKRSLLSFIGTTIEIIKAELKKEQLSVADMFSGSGIVSRYLKQHSSVLYTNDLEDYCEVINNCYLRNKQDINYKLFSEYYNSIINDLTCKPLSDGFITKLYAPKDDCHIKPGERVFYTTRNAMYIDTARRYIELVPEPYKSLLLAPLLYEASVHNNTSGVFKGFYKNSSTGIGQYGGNGKNALSRILKDIELQKPVLSNFSTDVKIFKMDANQLAKKLPELDVAYIDPPYNQHPYGSNYFMLNLITNYVEPKNISQVSGIPLDWNKSLYNKKVYAKNQLNDLCSNLKAKYLIISFNSDGFITKDEMLEMLEKVGEVRVFDKEYNTFRGSRNLNNRDIYVKEFLYLVKKY